MIKVNLLKSKVPGQRDRVDETNFAATGFGMGGGEPKADQAAAAVNLILMVIFVVALYFYSSSLVSEAQSVLNNTQAEASQVQTELTQKQAKQTSMGSIQSEVKELEGKVEILRRLTKIRVRELKALDYLQTIIPDRVWLSAIDYQDEKIKFEGFAISDDDLTEFLRRLEDRNFFSNVILMQATEAKTKEGTARQFEISAILETN